MAAASLLSGVTQLKQELAVKSAELGKASEQLKGAREQTAKLQDALHQAALDKKRLSTSLATITEESERLRSTSHVLEKRVRPDSPAEAFAPARSPLFHSMSPAPMPCRSRNWRLPRSSTMPTLRRCGWCVA